MDRGYDAIEALGDREWAGGWILPVDFLLANGFSVVRDDPRFPMLRLELRTAVEPGRETASAAVPLPSPAMEPGMA